MEPVSLNIFDFLTPDSVQPLPDKNNSNGAGENGEQLFGEMLLAVLQNVSSESKEAQFVPDDEVMIPRTLSAGSKEIFKQNESGIHIEKSIQPEPLAGSFEVINAVRKGEELLLDVIPKGKIESPVRISLPMQGPSAEPNGISLVNGISNSTQFRFDMPVDSVEDFLSKLNLKEVEITIIRSENNPEAAVVRMLGESETGNVEIQQKLRASQIKRSAPVPGESEESASINSVKQVDTTVESENESAPHEHKGTGSTEGKRVSLQNVSTQKTKEFESLVQTQPATKSIQNENDWSMTKTIATQSNETKPTIEQEPVKPVRIIVVPENIKPVLLRNQHSITLKIEPEHLGPARLDLQMKNDVLTARVIVDRADAKTALEGSLPYLKEQLVRADIKVEQIEINIRNESGFGNFSHRSPQWHRADSGGRVRIDDESYALTEPAPLSAYVPERLQYVNSTGVNLLA